MPYVDYSCQDEGDLHDGTRVCKVCGTRKPMSGFSWANKKRCRRRTCCECANGRRRELKRDPLYSAMLREAQRASHLRIKYGLDAEGIGRLEAAAGGNCQICRREFPDGRYHIDHCHETGVVRGLLCFTCNTALGKFRDDITVLESAIQYLVESREGQ